MTPNQFKGALRTMLTLQSRMNDVAKPDWQTNPPPYLRAGLMESVEGIDHIGWKWWKTIVSDLPQAQMEMIDVWHFVLSELLVIEKGDVDRIVDKIGEELDRPQVGYHFTIDGQTFALDELDTVRKLELQSVLFGLRRIDIVLFVSLCLDLDVSLAKLYKDYVGKNALNMFRQANGYNAKAGEQGYIKIWSGREDNEYLTAFLNTLDDDTLSGELYEQVMAKLSQDYAEYAK